MTEDVHRRRRRWPWVVGVVVVLIVAAAAAIYGIATTTGPSPRLAQVEQEPILVAPNDAVELGRQTRQSQWGLGLPNVSAYVVVAYQVDTTAEAAFDAWTTAYDTQYDLQSVEDGSTTMLVGSDDDVNVRVRVSDRVDSDRIDTSKAADFSTPAPGSTVVTVEASGRG